MRRRASWRCGSLLVGYCLANTAACTPPQTRQLLRPPRLAGLSGITRIRAPDSSAISGVAGLSSCDIVIADRSGRTWLVSSRDSASVKVLNSVPGGRALTLEFIDGENVGLWSETPPLAGQMTLRPLRIDSIPIHRHAWGGRWSGPITFFSGSRLAFSPLGNPDIARRQPQSVPQVQLVELRNQQGLLERSVGPAIRAGAGFLPWLSARVVLGTQGDTLLIALLEAGVLQRYDITTSRLLAEHDLPRYFEPQEPREVILPMPWIHYGETAYVYNTPQLRGATFDAKGFLYAIRVYGYSWEMHKSRFIRRDGVWRSTGRSLEVYNPYGRISGAYELPRGVSALRADAVGRLFLLFDTGEVGIFQNPLAPPTPCHG